jgi:hypothetical protein
MGMGGAVDSRKPWQAHVNPSEVHGTHPVVRRWWRDTIFARLSGGTVARRFFMPHP